MIGLHRRFQLVLIAALCDAAVIGHSRYAHAADALTPEEIAEGWILLFDGETTFGWKTDGDVTVKDGALHVGGEKPGSAELTTPLGSGELFLESGDEGFGYLTYVHGTGQVDVGLMSQPNEVRHKVTVNREGSGVEEELKTDGARLLRSGEVGIADPTFRLRLRVEQAFPVKIKTLKFRPTGLAPIFNGKDLTGWKPIPDKRSKFAVTEAGELSIRDGNGDLQTEAQWDDFVLQLEIKTNGTHLNSGVFFRAVAGEFWSGYESQIRNQWEGDDRTKPVDFGTGGVYGLQPARRVVSSDNEWFTKTIIATGNHIAVWVNGIQVSDFTDERRPRDSARRGSKTGPGVISLQGHDPTTDLSFRNIRIAPLSRPGT
jgi:hypothetical protein